MTVTLGYSKASKPTALRIAEVSDGQILAVRRSTGIDINWGRRVAPDADLNPHIVGVVNKHLMRLAFARGGVPAPRLLTADEARDAVGSGQIVLGRPAFHTRRQGFWLCRTVEDVDLALVGRGRKRPATHFLEWVDLDREFRVHVFGGKSLRISEKRFSEDHRSYTTVKPTVERRRHIRDAAKAAVAAVGLDFGAVDVLADNEEAMVLEVNASPGLGGSTPQLWAEAFIKWKEER